MASSFQEQAPDRTILTGLRNTDTPRAVLPSMQDDVTNG